MPNIIAGILILTVSFILGGSASSVYKKRIKFLNDYLEFIIFSEGEIEIFKREREALIKKFVAERADGEFTRFLRTRFLENGNVAINGEKKQVEEFVLKIGELDRASQKGFFKICREHAEKTLQNAENDEKTKGSLLKKLLPLGGAALFLIIV